MRLNGWLEISKQDKVSLDLIKALLTIPNPEYTSRQRQGFSTRGIPQTEALYEEGVAPGLGYVLRVPRGMVKTLPDKGTEVSDCRAQGHRVDFRSKIVLGPNEHRSEDQTNFVEKLVQAVQEDPGAIGQAAPGYGKTICALETVARLGRTTAVIVHKSFLMNQWVERIEQCFDIPRSEIGMIQQDVCDYKDKKIVLVMAQSLLSSREYPDDMFEYFGTVVVDEVHRFAASEFRKVIVKFPAQYRFGVTATPKRNDGLEDVFFKHIGPIAVVGAKRKIQTTVHVMNTPLVVTNVALHGMRRRDGRYDMNKVITFLVECTARNKYIVNLLLQAAEHERKIIVLSARREHLTILEQLLKTEALRRKQRVTVGYFMGGMSERDLAISATRSIMLATYAMAKEGLDIPELDTLFLVTPQADVEQSIGRIMRECAEKRHPLILDFMDPPIPLCHGLLKKRVDTYRAEGCIIK